MDDLSEEYLQAAGLHISSAIVNNTVLINLNGDWDFYKTDICLGYFLGISVTIGFRYLTETAEPPTSDDETFEYDKKFKEEFTFFNLSSIVVATNFFIEQCVQDYKAPHPLGVLFMNGDFSDEFIVGMNLGLKEVIHSFDLMTVLESGDHDDYNEQDLDGVYGDYIKEAYRLWAEGKIKP